MIDFLSQLFDTSSFPSRWHCGEWSPAHGWLHIGSDLATFGAYTAIPLTLLYFIRRRPDVPFPRIFWLFGLFIFSCGTVHLVEATIFWWPWYRLSGAIKLMTALASWATVLALVPMVPRALALPGLKKVNEALERENAERRLAEERFRATIEASPYAAVLVDDTGRLSLVNAEAERIFGYARAELLALSVEDLVPPDVRERHPDLRRSFLAAPVARRMGEGRTLHAMRKDGTVFPVEVGLTPLVTTEGTYTLTTIVDITERELARAEIVRRTEDLERSNRELDDFAYVASHDLREPLRGIHNYATFLLEDYEHTLDEAGREKLRALPRMTRRLDELIDSLLHFSRVGRVDHGIERVDLDALVHGVVESLQARLEEARAEVLVPRPLPATTCDRARVAEVFRNLVTNAVKYNDSGAPRVEISFAERNGHPTVFSVRDNGIGIAAKHRDAVFRIFKRLHARDAYGGGTGAGLTIAKKIVERHGGRIWFDSEPGQGTTFHFTLGPEDAARDERTD